MAYNTFVPEVWAEKIERDLEKNYVFAADCNRQWEGNVKKCGDTVHITGAGKPTIHKLATYTESGERVGADNNDIEGPEIPDGTEVVLVIDQIRYFNFMVDDVDKAQALDGLMDALTQEASEGLAGEVDQFVSELHLTGISKDDSGKITACSQAEGVAVVTEDELSADNILDTFDMVQQKLYENDVKTTTEVIITIPPAVYRLFRKAYITRDTDNSDMMKNGKVAKYGNMTVKMSNNVPQEAQGSYHIQVKTKRALAFAQPVRHIEAYRPQGRFADALKGFILFGGKTVRPEQIVDLVAKIAV